MLALSTLDLRNSRFKRGSGASTAFLPDVVQSAIQHSAMDAAGPSELALVLGVFSSVG